MGRKKLFESSKGYAAGAPRLATRVDPEVLEWIESRPEGTRPYIERVVKADKAAQLSEQGEHRPLVGESSAELPLSGTAEQAAEA